MEDPARRGLEPLRHVNDPPDDVVDGHEVEGRTSRGRQGAYAA